MKILKFISFFLLCQSIAAQENFVSTGGEKAGKNATISFTIGQIFYHTTSGNSIKLNTGLQIPYASYVYIKPIREKPKIIAYPNPTIDYLTVDVKNYEFGEMTLNLFNINGKLLESRIIREEKTVLNIEKLPTGIYLINISSGIEQDNVKIIKK